MCLQMAFSQQSLIFEEGNADFRNAMDLFQKEKFVAAQKYFEKSINAVNDVHSEVRIEAEFYHALCAIELFHSNAEALLIKFIERNPESPHLIEAYFNLAKFQFRKRKYSDVLNYLSKLDIIDLNKEQQAEYYFKKGYSHFQLEEFEAAATSFYQIKDTDNPYVMGARYYYGHISYMEGKYQTAANNFTKIGNDPVFGPLVPYYLTQIYYLQKKYDTLLSYAPAVLDSAPPKREDEIRKLIGDANYELGNYTDAIPYLEAYLQKNRVGQSEYYQLGYSHFKTKKLPSAIDYFQKAIGLNDTISQSAYYFIGEANILLDNKREARSAFKSAHQLAIDPDVTEDALFNYAKTAYELSYHPYDDAIKAFEDYINTYPNSVKLNDAYEYLLGVYYTTKNYKEALNSIERIKEKDIKLLKATQRLSYFRGIELYKEKDFSSASTFFLQALKHKYDPEFIAASKFWLAQSYYQLKDYENADNFYSDFLATSGAQTLPYYERGYYHMAYNFYVRKKYAAAIFWFREYIDKAKTINKGLITDAYLRTGDCYFIQSDFRNAIIYYNQAVKIGTFDTDYALLQSALASGILGDYTTKSNKLAELIKTQPTSIYKDDALFELGKTYLVMNKPDEAMSYYNQLINEFPSSNYLAETHLKVGLIHFNRKEDDLALNSFNTVVKNYSGSGHAKEALDKIRKIYIEKGDLQAFEDYINGVPFADLSKAQLDSTAYVIAENSYLSGNCEKATRDFTNYIKQYPKGIFSLNAHYYRADCEAKSVFYQEAANDFAFVVRMPQNKFTEKAVSNLVWIYRKINQPDSAISYAKRLLKIASNKENIRQADLNLMQLLFEKEAYEEASVYAKKILSNQFVDDKHSQQALMILAKANYKKENYEVAKQYLDTLSGFSNELGAEAKYLYAHILYMKGNYKKSDSLIYALINQVPSYSYWIAKGFILLADNFIAKDDFYNARLAFENVIDNAENEELINIAKEKLLALNRLESQKQKKEEKTIEVEYNVDEPRDRLLFEEDSVKSKNEPPKTTEDEE
tara:strand:+ start:13099 stop:16194 length:3096 start_codon:yes stop_codon:yes gene_type:complete